MTPVKTTTTMVQRTQSIDQSINQSINQNVFHINHNRVQHIHAITGVMWKGES